MTRPSAAYIDFGLSHPIRLVMNRGLAGNVAKLITIKEALELTSDLTSAIVRALEQEAKRQLSPRTNENCAKTNLRRADEDPLPPTG